MYKYIDNFNVIYIIIIKEIKLIKNTLQKHKKSILITMGFILSFILVILTFIRIENNYLRLSSILFSALFSIKFVNLVLVNTCYKLKNIQSVIYLHLFLSSFRLPLLYLLSFLYFYIFFDILFIEFNNEYILKYKNLLLGSINYFIILILSWTGFRIAQRIKDQKIKEYKNKNKIYNVDSDKISKHKYKTTNIEAFFKLINFMILILTILLLANEITGNIKGLIAFSGGLGIILGFSSRDFFSNFFGGIMIYMNRPFDIGDLIKSPDRNIEGVVQEIGWTAVKVETLEKRPLYIPNSIFNGNSIENLSRMKNRRIKEIIKIKFEDFNKIGAICKQVKNILSEHKGIDQEQKNFISLDHISNGCAELNLNCFTKTIELEGYHSIKHDLFIKIYKAIKENNCDILNDVYYLNLNNES